MSNRGFPSSVEKPNASVVHHDAQPPSAQCGTPKLGRWLVLLGLLIGLGLLLGLWPRWRQRAIAAAQTEELAVLNVKTVSATAAKAPPALTLSGEIRPLAEAAIYARTSGYVRRWLVDLGAKVQSGQLLAELDTPDLDRELTQARAETRQAEAALHLADATAKRWSEMLKSRAVSPQETEEKTGDAQLKLAALEASNSRLQRLEEIQHFAQIVAPFAGTVTERHLDIGQLVNAGTDRELFRLAKTEKVRVFVRVPQRYARAVQLEQRAQLNLPELPSHSFEARVVRTAGAIDAASRTLLVELEVDNEKGELLPGSYAQVRLSEAHPEAALTLPANTLIFRAEGSFVAVASPNPQTPSAPHKAQLRTVLLGRDFGSSVEVIGGISADDLVITNPPDSLLDGAEVRLAPSR